MDELEDLREELEAEVASVQEELEDAQMDNDNLRDELNLLEEDFEVVSKDLKKAEKKYYKLKDEVLYTFRIYKQLNADGRAIEFSEVLHDLKNIIEEIEND